MLKARVTKGFPLWYEEAGKLLTVDFVEVEDSSWLQAQIDAGVVEVEKTETKPETKPKTKQAPKEAV